MNNFFLVIFLFSFSTFAQDLPKTRALACRDQKSDSNFSDAGGDVNRIDIDGNFPLFSAIKCKEHMIVQQLLEGGAELDIKDKEGNTPLHCALANYNAQQPDNISHIFTALRQRYSQAKITEYIQSRNNYGETALFLALKYKCSEVITELLALGADPDVEDPDGKTWSYICSYPCKQKVIRSLLAALKSKYGSDCVTKLINRKDKFGETVLMLAVISDKDKLVQELLDYGADPDCFKDKKTNLLHICASLDSVKSIPILHRVNNMMLEEKNDEGYTPLMYALLFDKKEAAFAFIALGADIDVVYKNGNTPLHYVANMKYYNEKMDLLLTALRQRYIPAKVREFINQRNENGETALLLAVEKKHCKAVAELLKLGADPNIASRDGGIPLYHALIKGYDATAKILLENKVVPIRQNSTLRNILLYGLHKWDSEAQKLETIKVIAPYCNQTIITEAHMHAKNKGDQKRAELLGSFLSNEKIVGLLGGNVDAWFD